MTAFRLLVLCAYVALSAGAATTPTRAELESAEDGVREIVEDVLDGLRSGTLSRADAAEEVRIRACQVTKSAEEYLLLQGAFRLLVRAREFQRAAELLRHMRAREFPPEALASLVDGALEPVPRGEPVFGLDALASSLHDEVAHARKLRFERDLGAAFARFRVPKFSTGAEISLLDMVGSLRSCVLEHGGPRFHVFLQTQSSGRGIPSLPPLNITNSTLHAILDEACSKGGWTRSVHGRALLFSRRPGAPEGAAREIRDSGDSEETARRLKECRLGFVAFDATETLPEAAERLFLAVCDRAREGFDAIVLTPPGGPSPMRTVRAADITLYDALGLLCGAAGYSFEIKGEWVVLSPMR